MNITSKEDVWFKRQTEPATLEESILTRTLYKALLRSCDDLDAWNEEEKIAVVEKEDSEANENIYENFTWDWTVHGTQHFTMRSWFRRSIWAAIWLAMVIYSLYTCYNIAVQYYQYPTNTAIGLEEVDNLEFPAVTICSLASLTPPNDSWYENSSVWKNFHIVENDDEHLKDTCNLTEHAKGTEDSSTTLQNFIAKCLASNITAMSDDQFASCFTVFSFSPASFADNNSTFSNDSSTSSSSQRRKRSDEYFESGEEGGQANISSKHRVRRSSSASVVNISASEKADLRTKCDKIYQLHLYTQAATLDIPTPEGFKLGDISKCPPQYVNPKVAFIEDIICTSTAIFQDPFGFYNRLLFDCNPSISIVRDATEYICSSCCYAGIECMTKDDFAAYKKTEYWSLYPLLLTQVINKSAVLDGIDIIDKFQPSYDDIITASIAPEKVISTCSFDQGPCSVNKDFLIWPNVRYGTCYTFNSGLTPKTVNGTTTYSKGRIKSTSSYGPKTGLRITLNIFPERSIALITPELGARVIFHKPGTIPFPEEDGFTIPPGVSNSIAVTAAKVMRQVPPWGKCEDKNISSSLIYTNDLCWKQCLQEAYMTSCGCRPGIGPAYADMPTRNLTMCAINRDSTRLCLETVDYNYTFGTFDCDCPPSCTEWEYNAEFSTAAIDKNYFSILQQIKMINVGNDVCSNSSNNSVRLHVYFDSLAYDTMTATKAYTFDSFISNLGGNFGLFVGVSIISLVELTEFIIDAITYCLRKKSEVDAKREKKYSSILFLVDNLSGQFQSDKKPPMVEDININ